MSVKITDEMVEAALGKLGPILNYTGSSPHDPKTIRAALEAAISVQAEKGEAEDDSGTAYQDWLKKNSYVHTKTRERAFIYGFRAGKHAHPPAPRDDLVAEVERLKTTIRNTRSIVSEGAMTGFNPLDGDWADRLYSNQGALSAALEGRTDA